ncbi:hypothetical protein HMSSN036_13510 [Paenibacillus macerans]|nr:hypothetical protein HMSSN036_13510 [Paenibacillus macerans]
MFDLQPPFRRLADQPRPFPQLGQRISPAYAGKQGRSIGDGVHLAAEGDIDPYLRAFNIHPKGAA